MKNKNFDLEEDILKQLKTDISLKKFKEHYNKSNKKFLTIFKRIIAGILSLISVGGISAIVYANVYLKPVDNTNISYALIKDAVENGYIENMDMSYIYSNNIGIKINSLVMSDEKIDIVFDIDFNKTKIPENNLNIAMIIYDENKNIYYIWDTPNNTLKNKLYKNNYYKTNDLSNENYINASQSIITLYQSENKYIGELSLQSVEKYPKVKKLYINIYDIGYNEYENDNYKSILDNVNWSFEIDIPEKFYNRNSLTYKLKEENEIENFELEEINITETGTLIKYKTLDSLLEINIIDENGNIYTSKGTTLKSEEDNMKQYISEYELNKYLVTEKLYIQIEGNDSKLELQKISEY